MIIVERKINYTVSFLMIFYFIITDVKSQDIPYFQVSGTVRNESYQPVDYVHVINLQRQKGTVTDANGRFSLVCLKSDTLIFSAVGYKKKYLSIPDTAGTAFVFQDIYLEQDTVMIKEVMIFPWKTYSEFKKAFLALDLSDKNKENAERNMELIRRQILMETSSDPGLGYRYTMNEMNNKIMNRGVGPSNNLLNPLAWGRFIEALKNGDLKDKNRDKRKKNR